MTADARQAIERERSGSLQVALDVEETARLEIAAQRFVANGVPHTLMDGDAARALEPSLSPGVRAALLLPQHGYVRVAALTAALATAAANRGTTTTMATVQRIESRGSRDSAVTVTTSAGSIVGDAVIIGG